MKQRSYTIDVVIGLLLFCIFTASIFITLISGARAYKDISREMQEQYGERTCLSYIAAKIRHYDSLGSVYLTEFNGISALALEEQLDDADFVTYIYYYEGYVYELFAMKDMELAPEDGLEITQADAISFERVEDSLFRITCATDGNSVSLFIATRAQREKHL